jgi:hypothetical protein
MVSLSSLPRELCEDYLDKFPGDGFIWALYGEALARLAQFDEAANSAGHG